MKQLMWALPLFAVVACTGCVSQPLSVAFKPGDRIISQPVAEAVYLVVEKDARPFEGRSRIGTGFYSWIPLVPYGHQQFALETVRGYKPMPREVADTVINDLRAAGIARYVGYQDANDPRQRTTKDAYYLHLAVNEGVWNRYFTLYGVSFPGFFLWIAGMPVSYGDVALGLDAELKDSKGMSLGTQSIKGTDRVTEWIYHPLPFAGHVPNAYGQISPELREFVVEHLPKKTSP